MLAEVDPVLEVNYSDNDELLCIPSFSYVRKRDDRDDR
jgi:hypothetical protein